MKYLILIPLLVGCASYGIGMSVPGGSEEYFDDPMGVVRGSNLYIENIEGFCEQLYIPTIRDTVILNHCGALFIF